MRQFLTPPGFLLFYDRLLEANQLTAGDLPPDDAAENARRPPRELQSLVADKLMTIAKDPTKGSPHRTDALQALSELVDSQSIERQRRCAREAFALYKDPQFSSSDAFQQSTLYPFSRNRIDLGGQLQEVAVWTAAHFLPPDSLERHCVFVEEIMQAAAQMLGKPDDNAQHYATWAVRELANKFPGAAPVQSFPLIHPNEKTRTLAASILPLADMQKHQIAKDPFPRVRAQLLGRPDSLTPDILERLKNDPHPTVRQPHTKNIQIRRTRNPAVP